MESQSQSTILIVDDTEVNVDILVDALGSLYDVSVAMDGETAIETAREIKPDLILLDIMMPGMDGYEVCRHLKEDPATRDIPVIFLTALAEVESKARGFDAGAVDYVTKPFEIVEVKARVQTHLSLKQARESLEQLAKELEVRNRFIQQTFGRYVSDEVVDSILKSPEGMKLGGEKRLVTIMTSDLRGFTSLGERLPAESVVRILNIHFKEMTEIIFKYGGTIVEFVGDAILVVFGAPVPTRDHAPRAVACALDMQLAMGKVNEEVRRLGYPRLAMGIGVNTGEVIVGNIGSDRRTKYGFVGRNVNLTFRIESYAIGGQAFVSQSTRDACGSMLRIKDQVEVMPKGVSEPILIYEVDGIDGDFNVFLPQKAQAAIPALANPLSVRFSILTEKHCRETGHTGNMVRLLPDGAEIRSDMLPAKLANLRLALFSEQGSEVTKDLYAKVIDRSASSFMVAFTSVPMEAEDFLRRLLDPSVGR